MALEAKPAARDHLPEEALENYAFGRLPLADLAPFEEHLLFCEHCQQRLDAEDHFAESMRALAAMDVSACGICYPASAAPNHPRDHTTFGSMLRERSGLGRAPVWGIGLFGWVIGMSGAVACGFAMEAWLTPASTQVVETVDLKTLRGGGEEGVAEAKPNRPLELSIDMGEMADAPVETGPFRLEVVDATGNPIWTDTAVSSVSGQIKARVGKRLRFGIYWVRLYAHSGRLLREFSLHLG